MKIKHNKNIFMLYLISVTISYKVVLSIPGSVVVLHGISSAGKSSIAQALTQQAESPYLLIQTDLYIQDYLHQSALELGCKLEKKPWWKNIKIIMNNVPIEQQTQYGHTLITKFYTMIKEHALRGNMVIVDTIYIEGMSDFLEIMGNLPIIMVLVYAPLDKILRNLQARNNDANADEKRSLFISLVQYKKYFQPIRSEFDIVLDQLTAQTIQNYFDYAQQEDELETGKPIDFQQQFMQHFSLDRMPLAQITPVLAYDIIVADSELPALQRAQYLNNILLKTHA